MISDAQYDTLLITHTVGMIDDFQEALKECWRLLKPGGTLLLTAGSIAPVMEKSPIYWRFTVASSTDIPAKKALAAKTLPYDLIIDFLLLIKCFFTM
jgi:ubiquinone/menaquinone biosynthesis C-methylase UbiE